MFVFTLIRSLLSSGSAGGGFFPDQLGASFFPDSSRISWGQDRLRHSLGLISGLGEVAPRQLEGWH
jgi:hypothetical protein